VIDCHIRQSTEEVVIHNGYRNNSILWFLAATLLCRHVRNTMNSAHNIHGLLICLYVHGRDFTCLNHCGFSGFQVTSSNILSEPSIFEHNSRVILSLLLLLLWQVLSSKTYVSSRGKLKKTHTEVDCVQSEVMRKH
jgi:hypothetical protein